MSVMNLACTVLGIVLTITALTTTAGVAATASGKPGYHKRAINPPAVPAGLSAEDWAGLQQQVPALAQQAYLKPSYFEADSSLDQRKLFGHSVAVSGDTVVVGALWDSSNASGVNGNAGDSSAFQSGAAYVFVRSGTNWTQQAYLKASNAEAEDYFGFSVSISGDTVVVGAPFEDSDATGVDGDQTNNNGGSAGAAYVFVRNGTNWSQNAYLKASNTGVNTLGGISGVFGWSVSVSGDTLVVGAFIEGSNAAGVNGNQNDNSAIGAGAAYVFVRNGASWTQQAYLKASNTEAGDEFGHSVAISGDIVVVGAVKEASSATGVNGDQSDNTTPENGAAYVFARSGTTWSQQAYLKPSNSKVGYRFFFGWSVAVSDETVVVGAISEGGDFDYRAGAAYVFVRTGTTWTQQAYLKASNNKEGISFGSVAISGNRIVVGATDENSSARGVNGDQSDMNAPRSGAAYLFTRQGTDWIQQAYLKASNSDPSDQFGFAAAVSGETIVISSYSEASRATGVNGNQDDNFTPEIGAAYIFSNLAIPPDSDGDGVADADDDCPNTLAGAITDVSGCSIAQLVPCDGKWRNHGDYVLSLLKVTTRFHKAGLITKAEWRAILRDGLKSDCGKRRRK